MTAPAKIHLSEREYQLVNNSEWILTKQIIIEKVYDLFGQLLANMKLEIKNAPNFKEYSVGNGKISKGENYQGLPYVILDYPNIFYKDHIFAIRTMFWWGNLFSSTLMIEGAYKKNSVADIMRSCNLLKQSDLYICINDNKWQHHFEKTNYCAAKEMDESILLHKIENDFFKTARYIPVAAWDNSYEFLLNSFRELIQFPLINFPVDGRDLLPVPPKGGSGL